MLTVMFPLLYIVDSVTSDSYEKDSFTERPSCVFIFLEVVRPGHSFSALVANEEQTFMRNI